MKFNIPTSQSRHGVSSLIIKHTFQLLLNFASLCSNNNNSLINFKTHSPIIFIQNYNDRSVEINPFDFNHRKSSHSRSYNEKYSSAPMYPRHNTTTTSTRRRNMPITSTPYADMVSLWSCIYGEKLRARWWISQTSSTYFHIFPTFSYTLKSLYLSFDSQLNKNEKHDLTLIIRIEHIQFQFHKCTLVPPPFSSSCISLSISKAEHCNSEYLHYISLSPSLCLS